MGSKTNRSLQAKHERAIQQKRELGYLEGSKACFIQGKPAVPAYDPSMVKRIAPSHPEIKSPTRVQGSDGARVAFLKGMIYRGRQPKRRLVRGLLVDQGVL